MLEKVISGGQIGVDIAGLRAAKNLGIETGGYAPKDWMTLRGSNKITLEQYGLVECVEKGYPPRTELNVKNSDCTIRIAADWNTRGEVCTMRYITKHKKPYYDITMRITQITGRVWSEQIISNVARWIIRNDFDVINIAGNAKPFLEAYVEQYLHGVFYRVLDYKHAEVPDE